MGKAIAAEINLATQGTETNHQNVRFDVYFDINSRSKEVSKDINSKDLILIASVNVQNSGVLKNARIEFTNANFELQENVNKQSLELGTIQAETGKTIELPIQMKNDSNYFNLDLLNMISDIKLTGEYIVNEKNAINIDSTKHVRINWTAEEIDSVASNDELPIELAQELITNRIYNIEGENKRIIQYKLTSGLTDNKYPIKSETIEITVPKYNQDTKELLKNEEIVEGINASVPEDVYVSSYVLNATNQNEIHNFKEYEELSDENIGFVYNSENSKLTINVLNKANENNEIMWNKQGKDEFVVTYIYPADVQISEIEYIASSRIALYDLNNRVLTKTITGVNAQVQETGDLVNIEARSTNNKVYKSNMYLGKEAIYNSIWTAKISYPSDINSIRITSDLDKLETAEGYYIASTSNYKNTYIYKEDLDYILGEQGFLRVYDNSNPDDIKLLAKIDKNTQTLEDQFIVVENGIIAINYKYTVNTVLLEIMNPTNTGLLNIYHKKGINAQNIGDVPNINGIDLSTKLVAMQLGDEVVNNSASNKIALEEPRMDTDFGISRSDFSNKQENDVNFTVTLKTNDLAYKLYQNPVITIGLPDIVEEITLTKEDITILNSDELSLNNFAVSNNQIIIALNGTQTSYNATNTQISVNAKIKTKTLIPSVTSNIAMRIINQSETGAQELTKNQTVEFKSEQGILLETAVANYNNQNNRIAVFGVGNEIGKLDEKVGTTKNATVTGTIINNTNSDIGEMKIFGKVQNDSTSIEATLNTQVLVRSIFGENNNLDITVYYTEDENPSLESNWTLNATRNSTAYLAVCKNVSNATVMEVTYQITIPANLETNKKYDINYEVYSDNQKYVAPTLNLQTPTEVKLNLELTANVENGQTVYEGQSLVYNVKITNSGELDADGVNLNLLASGLTVINEENETNNLSIKAGESIEKQIKATVNKDVLVANFVAEATSAYMLQEAKATITNTVEKPQIEVNLNRYISTYDEPSETAQMGSLINYEISIINTSDEDLRNIQIKDVLPEELGLEDAVAYKFGNTVTINEDGEEEIETETIDLNNYYNEQTKEINIKINKLKPEEQVIISIFTNVENVINNSITNSFDITANDVTFTVTDEANVIGKPIITSSAVSNKEGNLNAEDLVEYTVKVKNTGETTEYLDIESSLSDEIEMQSVYYFYTGEEPNEAYYNFNSISFYSRELKQNQELNIVITAKANEVATDTNVQNSITIKGRFTDEIEYTLENTIIGTGINPTDNPTDIPGENPSDIPGDDSGENPTDNPSDVPGDNPSDVPGENPSENPQEQSITYSISGIAWKDLNKNGARENKEDLLKDVKVKIINAKTNEYLKDEKVTDKNGIYEFNNLKPGKYILVFEFDQQAYSATTYQKEGVNSTLNSDAKLVTEDNKNIVKTDVIEIKNTNVSNIDLGLVQNKVFDLRLDKYITKATVQNSKGTETYEYNKSQLAKVEISGKALEGSLVIVEYQIDVTNEGEVPAQVGKIVDYVSPQFEFASELNNAWFQGNDGNLYSTELANESLMPGETKTLKLVLTKTMNNNNTGLVNNAAEIYETYNEYAYQDKDSIVANKKEEDDLSEADIIISIKTGGPLLYIGIVIITMAVLSVGIYLINKKVIKSDIIEE